MSRINSGALTTSRARSRVTRLMLGSPGGRGGGGGGEGREREGRGGRGRK